MVKDLKHRSQCPRFHVERGLADFTLSMISNHHFLTLFIILACFTWNIPL